MTYRDRGDFVGASTQYWFHEMSDAEVAYLVLSDGQPVAGFVGRDDAAELAAESALDFRGVVVQLPVVFDAR